MKGTTLLLAGLFAPLRSGSTFAPRVDAIFRTLVLGGAALVAVLAAVNLVFLVRYRRGSAAVRQPLTLATWKIETAWIIATTAIFCAIFAWCTPLYLDAARPPPNALTIDVVARQWMWDVRQPGGRREFNTLHVPLHRPVVLRLTSEDVIHSLFVPAFRIKQDVVPGKAVTVWFEATGAGTYHLFCSQYCGTAHAAMIGEVIAQPPEEYAGWVAAGTISGDPLEHGRRLFARYGCTGCHAPDAVVRAPPLEGLYGRPVALRDGSVATADDDYLREAILEPGRRIVAGYGDMMPSFKDVIPEGDLAEMLAYLRSPPAAPVKP